MDVGESEELDLPAQNRLSELNGRWRRKKGKRPRLQGKENKEIK